MVLKMTAGVGVVVLKMTGGRVVVLEMTAGRGLWCWR